MGAEKHLPLGLWCQLLHVEPERLRSKGGSGQAPSHRGASRMGEDMEGQGERWIQQDTGWLPSCRTHRLLSGSGAEHAAVWGDGAAVDPLHVARQHLDLPPWGWQTCESREGRGRGSAGFAPALPSLSREGTHVGLGGSPWQIPSSVYLQTPPAPPRPHLEGDGSAPCRRTPRFCLEYCPEDPLPPSPLPGWVSPPLSCSRAQPQPGVPQHRGHPRMLLPSLLRSQTRKVLSREADTRMRLPLGAKLRSLTTSWCPKRLKRRCPAEKERLCSAPWEPGSAPHAQAAPLGTGLTPGKHLGKDGDGIPLPRGSKGKETSLKPRQWARAAHLSAPPRP